MVLEEQQLSLKHIILFNQTMLTQTVEKLYSGAKNSNFLFE